MNLERNCLAQFIDNIWVYSAQVICYSFFPHRKSNKEYFVESYNFYFVYCHHTQCFVFFSYLFCFLHYLTLSPIVELLLIYVRTDSWNAWIRLSNTHSITRILAIWKSPSCVLCCFWWVHFHLFLLLRILLLYRTARACVCVCVNETKRGERETTDINEIEMRTTLYLTLA